MIPQQLASLLVTWSRKKIAYPSALAYAESYIAGTLGEGLIKEFLKSKYENVCQVPTCSNEAQGNYCSECRRMAPDSKIVAILATIGEFFSERSGCKGNPGR